MNNILEKIDPFMPMYVHEKLNNPSQRIMLRAFQKKDVEAVDYLVRISQGANPAVETLNDWGILSKVFEFWTRRWPHEWHEFVTSIKEIRATRARKDGYSKQKGRSGVRYLGALPPRLMRLIKIVFPQQQWDREFTEKFTNNIKITKVGEKLDTWFTIPDAPVFKKNVVEEAVSKLKLENGNTKQSTIGS